MIRIGYAGNNTAKVVHGGDTSSREARSGESTRGVGGVEVE